MGYKKIILCKKQSKSKCFVGKLYHL